MSMPYKNFDSYIGKKYGKLTIVSFAAKIEGKTRTRFNTQCECGNIKVVEFTNLSLGLTKSCGCLRNEIISARSKANAKHGMTGTPIFKLWSDIKTRCYNKNRNQYKDYGERGIVMCDEWKNDFLSFYNWATKNGWQKGLQIDRFPDNNGNYEPSNCRFVTRKSNQRNRRNNILATYNGKLVKVVEVLEINNINRHAFYSRMLNGWPMDKAMTLPSKKPFK